MERVERTEELAQLIVVQELGVGHVEPGPTPHPFVGQRELSRGLYRATERVGGRTIGAVAIGKIARVCLKNAGGPDRVGTIHEPLAPRPLKQLTFHRSHHRRKRQVIVGRQRPEVGDFDANPVGRTIGEIRKQKAALARDRRIG